MDSNNIPIYKIIENDLKKVILDGTLEQGDLIPSETELSAKYNVSRMTVRQAINNLLIDGFIYRHKGRGTFVAYNKKEVERTSGRFSNFSIENKDSNIKITKTTVLDYKIIYSDKLLSEVLQLDEREEVIYIERLKEDGDLPLIFERIYLPYKMFPDITKDVFEKSFYEYIEEDLQWKIRKRSSKVEVQTLTNTLANLFKQGQNTLVLYVNNVTYLDNGRAFEYSETYYNSQYFRFQIMSTRTITD